MYANKGFFMNHVCMWKAVSEAMWPYSVGMVEWRQNWQWRHMEAVWAAKVWGRCRVTPLR